MSESELSLIAHLLRRAGFGVSRDELEAYAAKGYDATLEELLHPEQAPPALEGEDLIRRYHVDQNHLTLLESCQAHWLHRMVNTRRPLEEKLALFWHGGLRYGLYKAQSAQGHPQADRDVQTLWSGQLPRPAGARVQRPGDDLLAGQQRQPPGRG